VDHRARCQGGGKDRRHRRRREPEAAQQPEGQLADMAQQLVGSQQIVVGGQEVYTVLLPREDGSPPLPLSVQRPGHALTVGGRTPVDRSSRWLARVPGKPRPEDGPSRRRHPRCRGTHRSCPKGLAVPIGIPCQPPPIDGHVPHRRSAPDRPRPQRPADGLGGMWRKRRLQVGQPPQQVGEPVASECLLEGLRVRGVGQQDRLGEGTAKPVGLSLAEVGCGKGHQQLLMELRGRRPQLAWLPNLGLQQRLDRSKVRWRLAAVVEPPGTFQVRPHLFQQQPGPRQRVELSDADELLQAGLPALPGTRDVGVEQLGHMPAQDEGRDHAVPGGIASAVNGRPSRLRTGPG
jgi:hypothetical protein